MYTRLLEQLKSFHFERRRGNEHSNKYTIHFVLACQSFVRESYIRQEWDNISLPKVQQLVSSVPDVPDVVKRRGDATQWEAWTCPDELIFFTIL